MPDRSNQPAEDQTEDHNPEAHTLYQATIRGSEFVVSASTELDAKMLAASKFKENQSGPEIGQYVSELAECVELSPVNIKIASQHNYEEGFHVANGDPYIAVFSRTEQNDNAPSKKRLISLGTGYNSFDDLLYTTEMIIANPAESSVMVEKEPLNFVPTNVDLFTLCGTAQFKYE